MGCDEFENAIVDLAAGECQRDVESRLREHLVVCAACRENLRRLEGLFNDARAGLSFETPPELDARVRGRIDRRAVLGVRLRVPLWAAAAAIFLAAMTAGFAGYRAGRLPANAPAPPVIIAKVHSEFWRIPDKWRGFAAAGSSSATTKGFWSYERIIGEMRVQAEKNGHK